MKFGKYVYALLTIYLAMLGALYFFQRSILYVPEHFYVPPRDAGADRRLKEFPVRTEDGLGLKGWYAPAAGKPFTLVFFHGNADNLRNAAPLARPYLDAGYGFLLAEYRGYSNMPGSPTETGLYADARAYMKALIASGVPAKHIVLLGQSLGTGVAVQMATEYRVAGIMLVSPFLSMAKVAQVKYPIFPAEFLTKDRYENFRKIARVECPLLIAHGVKDGVVPLAQGERLFALANPPKEFHRFPEGHHNDIFNGGFFDVSLNWLARLPPPAASD